MSLTCAARVLLCATLLEGLAGCTQVAEVTPTAIPPGLAVGAPAGPQLPSPLAGPATSTDGGVDGGGDPGSTPPPSYNPGSRCQGAAPLVAATCGCSPVSEALIAAIDATQVTDLVKVSAKNCTSTSVTSQAGAGNATMRASEIVTCVETQTTLDSALKQSLSNILETAVTSVSPKVVDGWLDCFTRCTHYAASKCEPPAAREPTAPEKELLQAAVKDLSVGFLGTYQCHWMEVGARLANTLCGAAPCDPTQLAALYGRTIRSFSDQEASAVCDALRTSLDLAGIGAPPLACTKRTPWFVTNESMTVSSLIRSPRAQISLIFDLLESQVEAPHDRERVAGKVAKAWRNWAGASGTASFSSAKSSWDRMVAACGPNGCQALGPFTTRSSWDQLAGYAFTRWLAHFASLTPPDWSRLRFRPGCADAHIQLGSSGWKYATGTCAPGPLCLQFRPPINTDAASQHFASSVVP